MDKLNYVQFRKKLPILKGAIRMPNGQIKFGLFKAGWNKWSNSMSYNYYTFKGRKGTGGFDLASAFNHYNDGILVEVNAGDELLGSNGEVIIIPKLK